jgi:hypothetical protein
MSRADVVGYLKQVISFHSNNEEFNNTLQLHKLNTSTFQTTKDQDFEIRNIKRRISQFFSAGVKSGFILGRL